MKNIKQETIEKLENVSCPLCDSEERDVFLTSKDYLYSKEVFSIDKCCECNAIYTNPRVREESIGEYYHDEYRSYAKETRKSSFIKKVRWLMGKLFSNSRKSLVKHFLENNVNNVLEVGPGNGSLINFLTKNKIKCTAVEINDECVRSIKSKGVECFNGSLTSLEGVLEGRIFDAIIMIHVFEHLYDPVSTLDLAKKLLKPGGVLYLEVPDAGSLEAKLFGKYWRGYELPRHIVHYNKIIMKSLLENTGYRNVQIKNVELPSSFVESLGFVFFKERSIPKGLYYLLFYITKIIQLALNPLLGTSCISVKAEKKRL
jgi:2-polyprenyl-3-methyl-5-hydroxy-6-metoxy-1,4-benzoquinol methylase